MPSRKVTAAAVNRALQEAKTSQHNATAVRFSTAAPDPVIARMQEDIRAANDKLLQGTPYKNGTLLELDFNTGLVQEVPHYIDGAVRGFIVCDCDAAADIFRSAVDMARADTHVKLTASVACKAKVWVWR